MKGTILKMLLVGLVALGSGGCPGDLDGGYTMSYVREHCELLTDSQLELEIAGVRVWKENGVTRAEALILVQETCALLSPLPQACYECDVAVINYVYQD
jgi:hypothetical protein